MSSRRLNIVLLLCITSLCALLWKKTFAIQHHGLGDGEGTFPISIEMVPSEVAADARAAAPERNKKKCK